VTTEEQPPVPSGYAAFLRDLKGRIQAAQVRAAFAVSRELILLYWNIGRDIAARQEQQGWGEAVIRRLSTDLQTAFPGVEGFSYRNLYRMRAFHRAYPDEARFVTQPVSQIPWGHNIVLFQKLKSHDERLWYAQETVAHGWSRAILTHQIESGLYGRHGQAQTNFERTLPPAQSDLARQILKDPYNFDFLTLDSEAHERDLERGLLAHVRDFLLEMGAGFALLGSQYHIEVSGRDFYMDLLFYHVRLHCYVVVELKAVEFTPADAGQLNFYLSAVDDLLRQEGDAPTVGLILCKTRDRTIAEYALRDISKPLGIAEFRLQDALPQDLRRTLPTIGELEAALESAEPTDA